ncbi:asparagine synthase (glutamine-hydrolysing) [Myxococcus fulvus]|uniref:asparagine synthase (glutamine-hydrolyzing) n=1 Tax=Myxococcus fulvus TaxID=33 RepID=A0A511T6T5_MYXFU|nr:asparagine synthase (glutamine-hydrolyzing) [Myxococcus fulvus]GEN09667.1 asparagine synthase (glutamine-hydrolyzing) [Myxococcus fulvus]SEU33589.1 asparagine synthase (glutamine-hydrolysing) [Myxococcus fulvus]
MCGIAGFTYPAGGGAGAEAGERLVRMTASIRHRGPDAQRALVLNGVALGHTRLSIVDLEGGHQPMRDAATGLTVVFNGEIFNHVELREQLAGRYAFRTRSDTEVILAAFLTWGIDCVRRFEGQWAFALWDPRDATLWMSRDRVGICPLYYAELPGGQLAFGSEAKALFASGLVRPALDARGLKQTFQLWSPVTPRTSFEGVRLLPPAHSARFRAGVLETFRYWDLDFGVEPSTASDARIQEELGEALERAVRLRLRADVPVAAYLSGGLDSSLLCALAQGQLGGTLRTFSVGFAHARFDEREHQAAVAGELRTEHRVVEMRDGDIGTLVPGVIFHAEQAMMRSAPAPFLRLSEWVRQNGIRVVLTGEGSDEMFLGYDLFKETKVRQFWARHPASKWRPLLLRRLYPTLSVSQQNVELLREFFGMGLEDPGSLGFSHLVRWANSGRISRFLAPDFAASVADEEPTASVLSTVPAHVARWRPLARAQYLEAKTLLSGYLLSAQGDRMLLGNAVEGRFPFLDTSVMELAARIPERMRLKGLDEKHVLKRYAKGRVPASILERSKFPYRAPIAGALVGPEAPAWARELLAPEAVAKVGVFDARKAERLVAKLRAPNAAESEADTMALFAIASTQLLAHHFLTPRAPPQADLDAVVLEAA